MASRAFHPPEPLDVALNIIPSLPRPLLSRLVARAIERLDEIDGDPDMEDGECLQSFIDDRGRTPRDRRFEVYSTEDDEDDTEDCCLAGDDGVFDGPAIRAPGLGFPGVLGSATSRHLVGMDEDVEVESWPTTGAQWELSQGKQT